MRIPWKKAVAWWPWLARKVAALLGGAADDANKDRDGRDDRLQDQ